MVLGTVEAQQAFDRPVPHGSGGNALCGKADSLRHREPVVPQKDAHQVVGQNLRPVRPERDRRLLPCLPDEPVGVVGILDLLIFDDGQRGFQHVRAAVIDGVDGHGGLPVVVRVETPSPKSSRCELHKG